MIKQLVGTYLIHVKEEKTLIESNDLLLGSCKFVLDLVRCCYFYFSLRIEEIAFLIQGHQIICCHCRHHLI